jgi:hypothetical protein
MRADNTEPRDNQQIADDNQQSGVADEQVTNRVGDEGLEEDAEDESGEDEDENQDENESAD